MLTGQVRSAARTALRRWPTVRFPGRSDVAIALEGRTGWRFVAEEFKSASVEALPAEPAVIAAQGGRKKWPKTEGRTDARHLHELLSLLGRFPESWVPPEHVVEVRTLGYVDLMDERRAWQRCLQSQLSHQGAPPTRGLLAGEGRKALGEAQLSRARRQMVEVALDAIDHLTGLVLLLRAQRCSTDRLHRGARSLVAHCGVGARWAASYGPSSAIARARAFLHRSRPFGFAGRDLTVYSSNAKRSSGRLVRLGALHLGARAPRWQTPRPDGGPQGRSALIPHPPRAGCRGVGAGSTDEARRG